MAAGEHTRAAASRRAPRDAMSEAARAASTAGARASGKRYVRATSGRHTRWRWRAIGLTQLVYFGLPWLNWNGRQLLRMDLAQQRLYCLGLVLWPQDLIYAVALLAAAALALFLASALAERPWCGYACPHTVYSTLFMWLEERIEGGRSARMRNDGAPWSARRLARLALKQTCWLLLAAAIGWTLVAYFTPARALLLRAPTAWELFWMAAYGTLAYGNAGWLREQYCRFVCPYARFQSVMQDSATLLIHYELARGEPRGLRNRKRMAQGQGQGLAQGDCVDCTLCVQVCPAGIDIRHGLQYDCIGCGACIDACDQVMDKLGKPRGLIRYARAPGEVHGACAGPSIDT
jgi:cytochrome c oxidase accessory protein FixG